MASLDLVGLMISVEWHGFETPTSVITIDGQQVEGAVMRRRFEGVVQYRPMTEEELTIFEDSFRFS